MKKIYIGHWNNSVNQYPEYPFPVTQNPYDNSKDIEKIEYILSKAEQRFCKGFSICRCCGNINGSIEYHIKLDNISYEIPEGYLHYIRDHYVAVDANINKIYDLLKNK